MKNYHMSVVMPMYNSQKYIGNVLKSYLDQTYSNFEIIVIDDSSSDDSLVVAKEFEIKDPRVRVFKLEHNYGVGVARDFGNKKAKNEIIVVADSDDFAYKNRLEIINDGYNKNNDCDVFYTNLDLYYEDTKEIKTRFFQPYIRELLNNINFIPNASSSYKKSAYEQVKGYDSEQIIGEDYDLWLQFSDKKLIFCYDERSTVKVTMHSDSVRSRRQDEHRKLIERVWSKHNCTGADINTVKRLANEDTYKYFTTPAKLELWFK